MKTTLLIGGFSAALLLAFAAFYFLFPSNPAKANTKVDPGPPLTLNIGALPYKIRHMEPHEGNESIYLEKYSVKKDSELTAFPGQELVVKGVLKRDKSLRRNPPRTLSLEIFKDGYKVHKSRSTIATRVSPSMNFAEYQTGMVAPKTPGYYYVSVKDKEKYTVCRMTFRVAKKRKK